MFRCTLCNSSVDDEELDMCPDCRPALVWEDTEDEDEDFDSLRGQWLRFGLEGEAPLEGLGHGAIRGRRSHGA